MDVPLARYLTRFSTYDDVPEEAVSVDPPMFDADFALDAENEVPPELPIDLAAEEMDARLAEVRETLETAHAQALQDLNAAHELGLEQALAAARAHWSEAEGQTLALRLDAGLVDLRSYLADKIADVLTPLLAEAVIARTRAALIDCLDLILANRDHPIITMRGPGDLLDAIRSARPDATGIEYVAHDDLDAIVSGDGLRIETRLEDALLALTQQEH